MELRPWIQMSIILVVSHVLGVSQGWLWYTPASREQTIADCRKMKDNKSPFYPSYCEELLASPPREESLLASSSSAGTLHGSMMMMNHHQGHSGTMTSMLPHHPQHPFNPLAQAKPLITKGWGWSNWGEWTNDACPESCGRRCRGRTRYCFGSFRISCMGHGSEFDNCPGNKGSPYQWNGGSSSNPSLGGNGGNGRPGSSINIGTGGANINPGLNIPVSGGINSGSNSVGGVQGGLFGSSGGIFQGNGGNGGIDDSLLNGNPGIGGLYGDNNGRPLLSGLSGQRRDRRRRVRRPILKKTIVKEFNDS